VALVSRLDPWAPPLLLMALIFFFSHQPDLSSGLGAWDTIGRKILHAAEYALLCFLWWRALAGVTTRGRVLATAAAVSFAYAVSDELHQTFIEGRHGTPVDWAIDSAGAGLMALGLRSGLPAKAAA
jgi:VanZ family protein